MRASLERSSGRGGLMAYRRRRSVTALAFRKLLFLDQMRGPLARQKRASFDRARKFIRGDL